MLKFCAAGFIGPFELFSNRISRVLAALTLAHAIIIPLDNAEVGETDTALPVVAPVTVTLTTANHCMLPLSGLLYCIAAYRKLELQVAVRLYLLVLSWRWWHLHLIRLLG